MMGFLLGNDQSRVPTRFVLGVTEVLCGEGLPIWVFWVWRQSGVQVCAEHVHDDLETQHLILYYIWPTFKAFTTNTKTSSTFQTLKLH